MLSIWSCRICSNISIIFTILLPIYYRPKVVLLFEDVTLDLDLNTITWMVTMTIMIICHIDVLLRWKLYSCYMFLQIATDFPFPVSIVVSAAVEELVERILGLQKSIFVVVAWKVKQYYRPFLELVARCSENLSRLNFQTPFSTLGTVLYIYSSKLPQFFVSL